MTRLANQDLSVEIPAVSGFRKDAADAPYQELMGFAYRNDRPCSWRMSTSGSIWVDKCKVQLSHIWVSQKQTLSGNFLRRLVSCWNRYVDYVPLFGCAMHFLAGKLDIGFRSPVSISEQNWCVRLKAQYIQHKRGRHSYHLHLDSQAHVSLDFPFWRPSHPIYSGPQQQQNATART